ncbi:P-loop NTPase fold protein [Actinomadura sp. B10D3]|uniref:P-loop NTPase fold protein n=1 Tax=Actinomadura sp. B10D3 TaxID=3153557 RepID=UPI00325C9048
MTSQADHLPSGTLRDTVRELLEQDPELHCAAELHPAIVQRVQAEEHELSGLLSAEIAEVNSARRMLWPVPPGPALWAAVTVIAAGIAVATWRRVYVPPGDAVFVTAAAIVAALSCVRSGMLFRVLRRRWTLAVRELDEALRPPLRAMIRLEISRLDSDEIRWSNVLRTTNAPALVELNIQDTVSSNSYQRLRAFIGGHEASAVGLAGPRGSGKTTLMRQLMRDESLGCTVAIVSAPVQYTPAEFTRVIHGELARTGLTSAQRNLIRHRTAAPTTRTIPPIVKAALALAVVLVLVALWIFEKDRPQVNSLHLNWTEALLITTFLLVLGYPLAHVWNRIQNRTRLTSQPRTAAELCSLEIDFLRYSATVEASTSTAFRLARSGVEAADRLTRVERELSQAESVQALRQFIESLVALSNKPVVICVDELDKLADPETAIDAINGIKDLFHIPRCHFVLSVSTDALHSFAARGVPVRDAFDSSFDTIIAVSPLALEESRTLISRRARNFSGAAALFCHAWSGGHARDLIRTARACVEFRCSLTDDEATVATLARLVLLRDLRQVVDAAVEKLRREEGTTAAETLDKLLTFREAIEPVGTDLREVIQRAADEDILPSGTGSALSESQRLAAALAPYVRIAGLCERLFATPRTPQEWQGEAMRNAVTTTAAARASLERHPREIERRLQRAVDACAAVA